MKNAHTYTSIPTKLSLEKFPKLKQRDGIGLVVPFDFALDDECWRWLPPHTSLYITRTPYVQETAVTVNLAQELSDEQAVTTAVKSLTAIKPASIAYGCTSGSFVSGVIGEKQLQEVMLQAGAPAAVTASGALVAALTHLGAKTVAVATPYNESLTRLLISFLEESGFAVPASGYLDTEEGIARISYDAVRSLAKIVDNPNADAIFFSCTNLHTYDVIEELELLLGKPILSANQVMMWAALQEAKIPLPPINQRLYTQR